MACWRMVACRLGSGKSRLPVRRMAFSLSPASGPTAASSTCQHKVWVSRVCMVVKHGAPCPELIQSEGWEQAGLGGSCHMVE